MNSFCKKAEKWYNIDNYLDKVFVNVPNFVA